MRLWASRLTTLLPVCNVGGSLSDIWEIKDRGIPMAIFSATIFLGPTLGPIRKLHQRAAANIVLTTLQSVAGSERRPVGATSVRPICVFSSTAVSDSKIQTGSCSPSPALYSWERW